MSSRRQHHGRTDQRKAALKRKADAWALLECGPEHTRGAMYIGGYAIECKLKAIAMEVYRCWTLEALAIRLAVDEQAVYHHGLEALLNRLPSLAQRLRRGPVAADFERIVGLWRVSWRYNPKNEPLETARRFLKAVNRVFEWLEANRC